MSHKSLTEAAMEVLNKSRADAYAAPMEHEPTQPASAGEVMVGGATPENPSGPAMGKITAAARPQAPKPGAASAGATPAEPMKKLPTQPGSEGSSTGAEHVSPEEINGEQAHDYMKPTNEELTPEEIEAARQDKLNEIRAKMQAVGVADDVNAILSGESFSEDFKTKLTTIFEAAVIERAVSVVEQMEADILAAAEESVDEIKTELEEGINSYLTAMVEEWKQENQVAIEAGLKSEIVEDFMNGLRNLFAENYINIPSEKVDVVEALSAEVDELTEKLNNTMNDNLALIGKINEAKKVQIIGQACEGLTATQAAKVKTLAEGVEYTTEGDYAKKLKIIREGYVSTVKNEPGQTQVQLVESTEEAITDPTAAPAATLDPEMAAYVEALRRTQL